MAKGTAASERRVLDEAGGFGAMTGVMAIMLFLTVLAAAVGLGTASSTASLERALAGRLTVQIADGDPRGRAAAAATALAAIRAIPGVRRAAPVDRATLARLLQPWLGSDGADPDLPLPAMIDVEVGDEGAAAQVAAAAHAASPAARIDRQASWMSPVSGFMRMLTWLAAGLVALMAGATAAVVVLAARAGLETHRATIEVMHMLGSTDVQVARLFQRRIAIDAALGGIVGGAAALVVVALIGMRLGDLGSDLLGGVTLSTGAWAALAALPFAFVVLAAVAARVAVLAALRRIL